MRNASSLGSLVSVSTAGAGMMLLAGVSSAVTLSVATGVNADVLRLTVVAFGPPVLGGTVAAFMIARQRPRTAIIALAIGLGVQMVSAGVLIGVFGIVAAIVLSLISGLVMAPLLVMLRILGQRRAQDAGDTALLWGGLWSGGLHLIYAGLAIRGSEGLPLALLGLFLSALACAVASVRASSRRTFIRRVHEGNEPGYRIRIEATREEVEQLRPLAPLALLEPPGVLECTGVETDASAYRGGGGSTPIALVRVPGQ